MKGEIKNIIDEFREKFLNDEFDLRSYMIDRAINRPEEIEWLQEKLDFLAQECYLEGHKEGVEYTLEKIYNRKIPDNAKLNHAEIK